MTPFIHQTLRNLFIYPSESISSPSHPWTTASAMAVQSPYISLVVVFDDDSADRHLRKTPCRYKLVGKLTHSFLLETASHIPPSNDSKLVHFQFHSPKKCNQKPCHIFWLLWFADELLNLNSTPQFHLFRTVMLILS